MSLVLFLVGTVGGGLLVGYLNRPDEWYARLSKPWFTPPDSVFAPVWILLYVMIAFVGWRTYSHHSPSAQMTVWSVALGLNFFWSPVFFGLRQPGAALLVIVTLLIMIGTFIYFSWPEDAISSLLFGPYAAWVLFAAVLNAGIWHLNR